MTRLDHCQLAAARHTGLISGLRLDMLVVAVADLPDGVDAQNDLLPARGHLNVGQSKIVELVSVVTPEAARSPFTACRAGLVSGSSAATATVANAGELLAQKLLDSNDLHDIDSPAGEQQSHHVAQPPLHL